ncbi:hypothetical protein CEXT_378871 [Caerostris extrusa]|uniref:Uncharacterized protein n=1 Tax=Caerostris extrusa TaxID=172846 RepID=A0AAV4WS69_CAEEX|nr:hypothetical protein CEXT_378871 [Caerostris extrusa]
MFKRCAENCHLCAILASHSSRWYNQASCAHTAPREQFSLSLPCLDTFNACATIGCFWVPRSLVGSCNKFIVAHSCFSGGGIQQSCAPRQGRDRLAALIANMDSMNI